MTAKGGAGRFSFDYIRGMNRRTALLAPFALIALSLPALAAPISLGNLSKYLNSLGSVQTDFTQVNADGSVVLGKLYIQRPGRVRFEYAPPDKSLVLASAGNVAIFDAKSNQPPEQYPLRRTPLSLILADQVNLGKAKMVVGHKQVENTTRVMAQDPEKPEYGTIELVFTDSPVTLRQWIITDDTGQQTTVILGDLTVGKSFAPGFFNIKDEIERRKN